MTFRVTVRVVQTEVYSYLCQGDSRDQVRTIVEGQHRPDPDYLIERTESKAVGVAPIKPKR